MDDTTRSDFRPARGLLSMPVFDALDADGRKTLVQSDDE